jgi:hypothetical protein
MGGVIARTPPNEQDLFFPFGIILFPFWNKKKNSRKAEKSLEKSAFCLSQDSPKKPVLE